MNDKLREVYSLLIPISRAKLIVPRTAVAEVMGYMPPRNRPKNVPAWFLGMVRWGDEEVPLVSFEATCGNAVPESSSRSRITYFHALQGDLDPPVLAMLTQGYPYLVRVTDGVLSELTDSELPEDAPALAHFRMANERPIIPDLAEIERRLLTHLPVRSTEDA
jgi:chemosensory pili system protein ChpC